MDLVNRGCDNLSELLEDQSIIWNCTFSFIKSMSLKCAIELEIPDIIYNHGQVMTLQELTEALPIHPTKTQFVSRLMSLLVHSGFFAREKNGYTLTRMCHLLLKTNPCSARHIVLGALDFVFTKPWHYVATWFQNDDLSPFNTAFGEPVWTKAGKDQRLNHIFNEMMAGDSSLVGRVVCSECKEVFDGLDSLVDVGGGTGIMAKTIVEAFPNLECTVFDLPHVVAGLQGSKNLKYVGGDMFESIPSADAIMLKWVLHDWSDAECIKILKKCEQAIVQKGKEGKIIIIDIVMGNQNLSDKSVESQIYSDMEMMIHTTGRERNEEEWAKIFFGAGFNNYKIYPVVGFRALIEVFP